MQMRNFRNTAAHLVADDGEADNHFSVLRCFSSDSSLFRERIKKREICS